MSYLHLADNVYIGGKYETATILSYDYIVI